MVTNRDRKSFGSRRKKLNLLRRLAPLTFLIRVQAFWDPFRGELPHNQIFMNDEPNPLTWDDQLLSYWFSRNPAFFRDYLVNLNNNFRGDHCFGSSRMGASQVGNSPRLNWTTQCLTVAYDGTCSPNVSFRMEWISFASRCCWNCARPLTFFLSVSVTSKDLQFGTWRDSSFQRHYRFRPTTSGSSLG